MWTIDEGTVALVAGTASYNLPADTIDLMEHVLRTGSGVSQQDLVMPRISVSTYASIPNKLITGRPLQVMITRAQAIPTVTVWPVPDSAATYTLAYWRLRRIEDAGNGVDTADVNFRFLPALVAGLAYYISMKVPELIDRMPMLKQEYNEQFGLAAEEDREKATLRLVPRVGSW